MQFYRKTRSPQNLEMILHLFAISTIFSFRFSSSRRLVFYSLDSCSFYVEGNFFNIAERTTNYSRFVERSEFTSAKNGSAIDRKPSAGHYCAGLLSGDLQVTSIGSA